MSHWRRTTALSLALLALPVLAQGQRAGSGTQAPAGAPAQGAATTPGRVGAPGAAQAPAPPAGAPVILGEDTLFRVRVGVGAFTAAERATAASARLDRLAAAAARPGEVHVEERQGASVLAVDSVPILVVTEQDAAAAGVTRAALARDWAAALQRELSIRRRALSIRSIALGGGLALLATLVLIVVVQLLRRGYPRVRAAVDGLRASPVLTFRVQQLELISADRVVAGLLFALRLLLIVVLLALAYTYLAVVFSLFPWTQSLARTLVGYVVAVLAGAGNAFATYLPKLVTIAAIIAFTAVVTRLIRVVFDGLERGALALPGFYPEWARPTYKLVRLGVLLFAVVLALPNVPGFGSEAFRGVSIFFGLLLSLGSAGAVGNAVAGVLLVYMRPFRVGDRVRIADTEGDVVERTLLITRVRTIKNVDITVPNSTVLASHIINYSAVAAERGMILHTTVTIGYDAPWRQVHELLLGAARATEGILVEPPPFVLQTALNDFYVSYQLNAYTDRPARMALIYSELHQAIQDHFNEAGVEITSPHFAAVRDGNSVAIPAQYLPAGYMARAFRVGPADGNVRTEPAQAGPLTAEAGSPPPAPADGGRSAP